MYSPSRVPLDPSQLASYLEKELGVLTGAINGYATKRIVPVWSGSVSDPVLGNGSLYMRYQQGKDLCELWLQLAIGSTTTFGSGEWRFEVPTRSKESTVYGEAFLLDNGTTRQVGACQVTETNNLLRVYAHGQLNPIGPTNPWTWATDDVLFAHIRYLC